EHDDAHGGGQEPRGAPKDHVENLDQRQDGRNRPPATAQDVVRTATGSTAAAAGVVFDDDRLLVAHAELSVSRVGRIDRSAVGCVGCAGWVRGTWGTGA